MKNIILISFLSVFILSCKSNSATSTKLDTSSQVSIKGNWIISAVRYPGSDVIKVNSFDIADSKCFVGSNWKFISNNNKGEFSLNSPKCTAYSSPITWFINKEGQFVLKILDDSKARKVKEGYVLKYVPQSENMFELVDRIDVAGKMTDVVYQFNKN